MDRFLIDDELRNKIGQAAESRIRGFSQENIFFEWQNVIDGQG